MQRSSPHKKLALLCVLTLLLSLSARGFSINKPIVIRSETTDQGCHFNANYEAVKARVLDMRMYQSIDDQIPWSSIWLQIINEYLPNQARLGNGVIEILGWFDDNKLLDMTFSREFPLEPQNVQADEIKRSKVMMAFSPLGLDRSYANFYPKIPLICSVFESNVGEVKSLRHQCDLTKGPTYAITGFASDLTLTENECGSNTLGAIFRVELSPNLEHIEQIYRLVIRSSSRFRSFPSSFLSLLGLDFSDPEVLLNFQEKILSAYFRGLYDRLLRFEI